MSKKCKLYKCRCTNYFTENIPDCHNCHTVSCMYNIGFSKNPEIIVKDVVLDDSGNIISQSEEYKMYKDD